jgi:hypothetical protein
MFLPLFSDSVYISESKTTYGMFWIITFAVDSQTHTVKEGRGNNFYLVRHQDLYAANHDDCPAFNVRMGWQLLGY